MSIALQYKFPISNNISTYSYFSSMLSVEPVIKIILLIFVALLLIFDEGSAQWYKQDVPTTNDLFDVHFVNPNVGWIVGMNGTILHTTNGGTLWESQTSPDTSRWLLGVFALDENICWAVGVDTLIIKTTDGGKTWLQMNLNIPILDFWVASNIVFSGIDTGWIAGYYRASTPESSFVLKTTNGGLSWVKQRVANCDPTFMLDLIDNTHVWLTSACKINRTTDGTSWETISSGSQDGAFVDIDFVTSKIGWITKYVDPGLSAIFRSDDSGKTGQVQHIFHITGGDIYTSFVDTLHGWVVQYEGLTDALEIWGTTNGGVDWYMQLQEPVVPGRKWAKRIMFVDSLNGWMIGEGGIVFNTPNGGVTDIDNDDNELPEHFSLSQNYPNPFNSTTTIDYNVPYQANIVIKLFDVLGREIKTIVDEMQPAGSRRVTINFDNLSQHGSQSVSSGIYFYSLASNNVFIRKSMLFVK